VPDRHDAHDINVIGAFALAIADGLNEIAEQSSQVVGAGSAALVALAQLKGGRTINELAMSLRISHSRAVRIGDALESARLARRVPSAEDGRVVQLRLTRKGMSAAGEVQRARARMLETAVDHLTQAEVSELSRLVSKVLMATTTGREQAHSICRLCDADACGHYIGTCPVTCGARARGVV
jgi:MarR family transcriptional regulator, negative regulator of the multidrug operon emrRAB